MIEYGIVGIGGFAETWVRSLQALERRGVARLAAAVVRDRGRYVRTASLLEEQGCMIVGTFEELLSWGRDRLHVVGVPTGIGSHEPLAVQAMEAGYNVLIEKPIAATVQEVASLRAAEERTGRWCAVGYQFIYSPTIQWLREQLASGALGALLEARTTIGWPRPESYYTRNRWAGALRDGDRWILDGPATNATAHHLVNMLYLADVSLRAQGQGPARIESVQAELYRSKPIDSYDTSAIAVRLAGGVRLLHLVSHSLVESIEPYMDITCERGTVHWEASDNSAVITFSDGREERFADPEPGALHTRVFAQVAEVAAGEQPAPLCGLAEGGPHVLVINLAFESSAGIIPVGRRHCYQVASDDDTPLVCIHGMEQALQDAHARGVLFSGLGQPWTRETEPASPPYEYFPQSPTLRRALGLRQ